MRASLNRSDYRVKFYSSHIGPLKTSSTIFQVVFDISFFCGRCASFNRLNIPIQTFKNLIFQKNMPVPMGEIVEELGADLDARFQPSFPGNMSYLKK